MRVKVAAPCAARVAGQFDAGFQRVNDALRKVLVADGFCSGGLQQPLSSRTSGGCACSSEPATDGTHWYSRRAGHDARAAGADGREDRSTNAGGIPGQGGRTGTDPEGIVQRIVTGRYHGRLAGFRAVAFQARARGQAAGGTAVHLPPVFWPRCASGPHALLLPQSGRGLCARQPLRDRDFRPLAYLSHGPGISRQPSEPAPRGNRHTGVQYRRTRTGARSQGGSGQADRVV